MRTVEANLDRTSGRLKTDAHGPQQPRAFFVPGVREYAGAWYIGVMYKVETEQESDGRWIAEVPELPGVMTYGATREEAVTRSQALALRVLAERLEHGEDLPQVEAVFSIVA